MQQTRKRLGDLLVETGVISQEQLLQALKEQKNTKLRLGDQLAELGLLQEQQLIEVLEFQLGIPHVNLYRENVDQHFVKIIDAELANRYQVLPLRKKGNKLIVAMSDPLDYYAIDDIRLSTGFQVEPVIAKKDELRLAINRYYGMQKSIELMVQDASTEPESMFHRIVPAKDDSPAAQIVYQLFVQAVELGASDIHIDALEDQTKIRFRIDGVLRTERVLPKHMHSVLTSRIKIMSKLNIAEKRVPQDGRFQIDIEFRMIDVRVSSLPTFFGEKIVMRILDLNHVKLGIHQLGFSKRHEQSFKRMIQQAYGLVLVTGPTGSGKTTTLYSALHHLNTEHVNIITIEDPVEYQIEGVNQVQVNPTIGMTFALGLRSMLRQDPNIIMVGEIRDSDTAETSLRAAMTGHLVLSTLHTNDAVSSITRLIDMGIEPFLVSSSLIGVVGQRLVRKVCPACVAPDSLNAEEKELFVQRGLPLDNIVKGSGCATCSNSGYRGRVAIQEVITIDKEMQYMITQRKADAVYRAYLQQQKAVTMFDDGLEKVALGITTLEEVFRVAVDYS